MARLFHSLVVAGAAISASASAGKSTSNDADDAIVGPACDEAIDEVVLPGLEQALGASLSA